MSSYENGPECLDEKQQRINGINLDDVDQREYNELLARVPSEIKIVEQAIVPPKGFIECEVEGCRKKLAVAGGSVRLRLLPLFIPGQGDTRCVKAHPKAKLDDQA